LKISIANFQSQRLFAIEHLGLLDSKRSEITCSRAALDLDNWSRLSRKTSLEKIKTA
jgi:hypothetical protein